MNTVFEQTYSENLSLEKIDKAVEMFDVVACISDLSGPTVTIRTLRLFRICSSERSVLISVMSDTIESDRTASGG
jgi:hypothetical protein